MTVLATAIVLAGLQVGGAQTGTSLPSIAIPDDPRIQIVAYAPDRVFDLRVSDGFAAIVELAPDERVESVVVGNTAGWEVTPNRSGNRVVVKPLATATTTNMVVVTDQRRYVFVIAPDTAGAGIFVLRFFYPAGQAGGVQQSIRAADYRIGGNRTLHPIAMSDDGKRTTITWDRQASLPAIFTIDDRGREALVNGRMDDGDYVIEGVAKRYVFRLGKAVARATRVPFMVAR